MPYSYSYFKEEVKQHLINNFNSDIKILDVGAGSGSYGLLLKSYFNNIDAIEIFHDYIYQFKLNDIYKNVYKSNILDFDISKYDYIIFGDIIEHLSIEDSDLLLKYINNSNKKCIVAIPYLMKQEEVNGNIYELHKQDDLTNDIFIERYPYMKLLYGNDKYGYYINY